MENPNNEVSIPHYRLGADGMAMQQCEAHQDWLAEIHEEHRPEEGDWEFDLPF